MENNEAKMAKTQPKTKEIKFCPKCGSEDVRIDSFPRGNITNYCGKCGFNSRLKGGQIISEFPIKSKKNDNNTRKS